MSNFPYYPDHNVGLATVASAQLSAPEARPSTALEGVLEACESRRAQAQHIHIRLVKLLTKLQGDNKPDGSGEGTPAPSGLLVQIHETLRHTGIAQTSTIEVLLAIEALI